MVHEDFLDRSYRSSLDEPEYEFSRPIMLAQVSAAESSASKVSVSPLCEELNQATAAAASEKSVQAPPWQAVARAKGRPGYFLAKRCLDVTIAALALLLAAPLMAIVAVLIRLTSPGPALFCQERVGFGGRRFTMYKFRSMYVDSDDRLHRSAYEQFLRGERKTGKVDGDVLTAEQAGEGSTSRKTKRSRRFWTPGDPRVTPLGYFLRRTSIDELPQFFNVLRGEMSLVGPRPPIPYEVGLYQPWHLGRLDTLSGITGLWQVHGRSRVTFDQMVQMDLEYIQQQSFWYDVKLLLLTIPAVLSRKGAY